jgi:murein DD-endopeptidase MepM/ murein hydrolase activator NlpD
VVGRLLGGWRKKSPWLCRIVLASAVLWAFTACSGRQNSVPQYPTVMAQPHLCAIPELDWPVANGKLSSGFGLRHGAMHEGIDIAAPEGSPVTAAASGQVIYVGRLRGYGNIVIIQHENHYVTVYAHDSSNVVRAGQMVRRGQVIGFVGRTGRTSGANLHFEVRHNNIANNPLLCVTPSGGRTRLAAIRAAY